MGVRAVGGHAVLPWAIGKGEVGLGAVVLQREAFKVAGYLVVCGFEGVVVVYDGEGAELVAFLEDLAAGHDVDCKGCDDADPVERVSKLYEVRTSKRGFIFVCVPSWAIAYCDT